MAKTERELKFTYVNGLTGFQIHKVLVFSLGKEEDILKWGFYEDEKCYKFFIKDKYFDNEKMVKVIQYFEKFWQVKVLKASGLD